MKSPVIRIWPFGVRAALAGLKYHASFYGARRLPLPGPLVSSSRPGAIGLRPIADLHLHDAQTVHDLWAHLRGFVTQHPVREPTAQRIQGRFRLGYTSLPLRFRLADYKAGSLPLEVGKSHSLTFLQQTCCRPHDGTQRKPDRSRIFSLD